MDGDPTGAGHAGWDRQGPLSGQRADDARRVSRSVPPFSASKTRPASPCPAWSSQAPNATQVVDAIHPQDPTRPGRRTECSPLRPCPRMPPGQLLHAERRHCAHRYRTSVGHPERRTRSHARQAGGFWHGTGVWSWWQAVPGQRPGDGLRRSW